ncbi:hypothetical protein JZU46_02410 [bacterium]|nr:hypothetical protein [bacterium]
MKVQGQGSESQCAHQMKRIEDGELPLDEDIYFVIDIAERYHVREDTVFKGVRSGDPMYPRSHPLGSGPRPRIAMTREEVEACDARRLAFYKTTPSWIRHFECTQDGFPARKSARSLLNYPPARS